MHRFLSKSRFTSALECPTKLDYVGKPDYVDTKNSNEFLKALAEGGFQVGELAKLYFPEGVEVTDPIQSDQIDHTKNLLAQDAVTIFEATVSHDDFIARIDVLRKRGDEVDLIEVKSKSYDSREGSPETQWRGKPVPKGSNNPRPIKADMLSYLRDIAFQTMLVRMAFPHWKVTPYLMLPDKARKTSIAGINQRFKIEKEGLRLKQRSRAVTVPGTTLESLGDELLIQVDVTDFVNEIINGTIRFPGGEGFFKEKSAEWAAAYALKQRVPAKVGKHCRKCEFYSATPDDQHKSGFHQCWTEATRATFEEILEKRPITELFSPAKGEIDKFIAERGLWLSDLEEDDFEDIRDSEGMGRKYRQYLQVFGQWGQDKPFEFDQALWRNTASGFTYPLHFIDFEGARPALPFLAGKHPYAQVAFQFSHHTVDKAGQVTHANEFIDLTPGSDPSIAFLRSLKKALCADGQGQGTVFMWSPYENTMLNDLRSDLLEMKVAGIAPGDADDLIAFVDTLTTRKNKNVVVHRGERAMVDLYALAGRYFFHPDTQGRSSIKVVLPAVMKSSKWLKDFYSKPVYGAANGIPSKNFPFDDSEGMIWWIAESGGAVNPYKLLPPVFADIEQGDLEGGDQGEDGGLIREGGAATTAYARMQFTDVPDSVREATRKALLRYCELDTLAMVMIYQAWTHWADSGQP